MININVKTLVNLALLVTMVAAGIVPVSDANNQLFGYTDTGEVYYNSPKGQTLKLGWVSADKNTLTALVKSLQKQKQFDDSYYSPRDSPEEASFPSYSLYGLQLSIFNFNLTFEEKRSSLTVRSPVWRTGTTGLTARPTIPRPTTARPIRPGPTTARLFPFG